MRPRPLDLHRDLPRLLDIVAAARLARGSDFVHPGGLQWLLRRLARRDFEVTLWCEGDSVLAFSVVDSDYAIVGCAPEHAHRHLEILGATEDQMRAAGGTSIEVSVWEHDTALRDALADRGYTPSGTSGPELVYDAPPPPAAPVLPPNLDAFRLYSSSGMNSTRALTEYRRPL